MDERLSYARWVHWENAALEAILCGEGVNLVSDFEKTVKLLQDIPVNDYEFPELKPLEYGAVFNMGA